MANKQELLVVSGRKRTLRLTGVGGVAVGMLLSGALVAGWTIFGSYSAQHQYEARLAKLKLDFELREKAMMGEMVATRSQYEVLASKAESEMKVMREALEKAQLQSMAFPCNRDHPMVRLLWVHRQSLASLLSTPSGQGKGQVSTTLSPDARAAIKAALHEVQSVLEVQEKSPADANPVCRMAAPGQDPGPVVAYLGDEVLHRSGWRLSKGGQP